MYWKIHAGILWISGTRQFPHQRGDKPFLQKVLVFKVNFTCHNGVCASHTVYVLTQLYREKGENGTAKLLLAMYIYMNKGLKM